MDASPLKRLLRLAAGTPKKPGHKWIPAHIRMEDGKPVQVEGHFAKIPKGDISAKDLLEAIKAGKTIGAKEKPKPKQQVSKPQLKDSGDLNNLDATDIAKSTAAALTITKGPPSEMSASPGKGIKMAWPDGSSTYIMPDGIEMSDTPKLVKAVKAVQKKEQISKAQLQKSISKIKHISNPSWAYGPSGKLRNIKAMGDQKLLNELGDAEGEFTNSDWYEALWEEADSRDLHVGAYEKPPSHQDENDDQIAEWKAEEDEPAGPAEDLKAYQNAYDENGNLKGGVSDFTEKEKSEVISKVESLMEKFNKVTAAEPQKITKTDLKAAEPKQTVSYEELQKSKGNPEWAYGPSGAMRNVGAMGDAKLMIELGKADNYKGGTWWEKLTAEAKSRGWTQMTPTSSWTPPSKEPKPDPKSFLNPAWSFGPAGKMRNVGAMGIDKVKSEMYMAAPYKNSEWYKKLKARYEALTS